MMPRFEIEIDTKPLDFLDLLCAIDDSWGVIAAFQILKDEASREQYDYAIAHPEEVTFC